VPPWRPRKGWAFVGVGNRNTWCQVPILRAGKRGSGWLVGHASNTRVSASDHHLLS
jgi:hypothetical protein